MKMSDYNLAPKSIVDELAQFIRKVDGNNRMGAGALADKICERFHVAAPAVQGEPVGEVRLELGSPSYIFAELYSKSLSVLTPGTKLYAAPQPAGRPTFFVGTDLSDGKLSVVVMEHQNGTARVIHSEVIQLAEQQPDVTRLVEALEDLVSEVERTTCVHENTHRGGVLWEICEDCGGKWADDRGGKPEFAWPESVETARNLIHAHRKQGGGV